MIRTILTPEAGGLQPLPAESPDVRSDLNSAEAEQLEQFEISDESSSVSNADYFELGSVGQYEERTFITEPSWKKMLRLNRAKSGSSSKDSAEQTGGAVTSSNRSLKGYAKGNFIQRNIALGPDARYYDAMTEQERQRVESLLSTNDDIHISDPYVYSGGYGNSDLVGGYLKEFCGEEVERLEAIDRELEQIARLDPSELSIVNTAVWSPSVTSNGTSTPVPPSSRDVELIMTMPINAVTATRDDEERLRHINMKLEELHKPQSESKLATRDEIEALVHDLLAQGGDYSAISSAINT